MKKRVAVIANGWNSENLSNFMMGVSNAIEKESMDFFVFLSYAVYGFTEAAKKAEGLCYDLPDLKSFDAIIIFGPGLNFKNVIESVQQKADEAGCPVISIGLRHPGHYYIGADNYSGMKVLTDHMIEKHNVKNIMFFAGSKENGDSNERLKAIMDACKEHNIDFDRKKVFYSDWETSHVTSYLMDNFKSRKDFPDVFMCANDLIALGVNRLMENYYHLGVNSVKITGFDYLDSSKTFYPTITTVDQCYDVIGEKAAFMLEDIFSGKKTPKKLKVECKCVIGESCGCGSSRKATKKRHDFIRQQEWENRMAMYKEGRLFSIERAISQGQSFNAVKKQLQETLGSNTGVEGDDFYLMFDPMLEKVGDKEESMLPRLTLADDYLVVVAKHDSQLLDVDRVDRTTIVPGYTGTGKNKIYTTVILRNEDLICGYLIMGMDAVQMRRNDINDFMGRINRAFFTYIRNLQLNTLNKKLADLMEQDSLTHVKNRTAYDKYVKNFKKRFNDGEIKEYAVAYFDINNLKVVNDKYGHEAGDAYIRNSCKLICDTFKHSPVFRIGGDEFLSILYNDDFKNRDALLVEMKKEMAMRESMPEKYSPAARVSVASGLAVFDATIDADLMSVVNRADTLMYEDKYKMKKGEIR